MPATKLMNEVECLYCGKPVPADAAHCPHCGAVSHNQKSGYRAGARRRFILLFLALAVFVIVMAFWLPRTIG